MKTLFCKNTILLISLVFCFGALSAQDAAISEKKLPTFNIFNNSDYTITGVAIGDFELKFTMKNKGKSKPEYVFSVNNFNIQTFKNGFRKGVNDQGMDSSDTTIRKEAATLFYYYIAGVNAINQNLDFNVPVAGVLTVVDTSTRVMISQKISRETKNKVKMLKKGLENRKEIGKPKWKYTGTNNIGYANTDEDQVWFKNKKIAKEIFTNYVLEEEDKKEKLVLSKLNKEYDSIVTKYEEEIASLNYYTGNFSVNDSLLKVKVKYIKKCEKNLNIEQNIQNDYLSERPKLEQLLIDFDLSKVNDFISKYNSDSIQLKFYITKIKFQINAKATTSLKKDAALLAKTKKQIETSKEIAKELNNRDSLTNLSQIDSINELINNNDILLMALIKQADSLQLRIDLLQLLIINKDIISETEAKISFYIAKIEIAMVSLDKLKFDVKKNRKNVRNSTEKVNKENQALYKAAYKYYTGLLKLRQPYFKITETEIELKGGYMENVRVKGEISVAKLKGGPNNVKPVELIFENLMPVGFSREIDYEHLSKVELRALHPVSRMEYRLKLGDIMSYDLKHAVNRRDYSPKNQMITFSDNKTEKTLKKQDSYKLFEIKVYSDFVGMNETAPNGLIQSELEKEIPILTRRYPAIKAWRSNCGYLEQVVPKLVLSKLEDKNKYLPIRYHDLMNGSEYTPEKYVSTLELYQYESFSTGIDVNILVFDIINAKSTIRLDGGFRYGTTPVVDSTRIYDGNNIHFTNEFQHHNITTFRFFPRISLSIYPEERFSIKMSFTHSWYYARTNLFTQVGNITEFELDNDKEQSYTHQFNTVELKASINMQNTSSGKLFFRYRFNWQQNYWNTGFSQIQVGYAFYLMGKYKQ